MTTATYSHQVCPHCGQRVPDEVIADAIAETNSFGAQYGRTANNVAVCARCGDMFRVNPRGSLVPLNRADYEKIPTLLQHILTTAGQCARTWRGTNN